MTWRRGDPRHPRLHEPRAGPGRRPRGRRPQRRVQPRGDPLRAADRRAARSGAAPDVLHQVLHDEPRPPRQLNDRIPRDLETICLKAMAKEPDRRYATARRWPTTSAVPGGEPIRARPVGRRRAVWSGATGTPPGVGRGVGRRGDRGGRRLLAGCASHGAQPRRPSGSCRRTDLRPALGATAGGRRSGAGVLWLARGLRLAAAARDDRLERTVGRTSQAGEGRIHALKHLPAEWRRGRGAEFSRDGRMVADRRREGSAQPLGGAAGGPSRAAPGAPGGRDRGGAFSPDGSAALTGSETGQRGCGTRPPESPAPHP